MAEIRAFLERELAQVHSDEKQKTLEPLARQIAGAVEQNDDYIFLIINQLEEIQHMLEANLKNQRGEILDRHVVELEEMKKNFDSELANSTDDDSKARFGRSLEGTRQKHKIELKLFDRKIYGELVQKVCDQQDMLQRAGIVGFKVTEDVEEIKFQMALLAALQKYRKGATT